MTSSRPKTEGQVLDAFQRVTRNSFAYRTLLEEHGVHPDQVIDIQSFSRLCPVLSKRTTFDRFRLDELCATGGLTDLAEVLTSSGHGGRFSYGLINRNQAARNTHFTDQAIDAAFAIHSRSTLAINCLPMGVRFSSHCMTVATTSVREDMAVAIVQTFGEYYEQILIVGDPLFMTRLVAYARHKSLDWSRYRVNVMIGEEIFGEHFREYLSASLGLQTDRPEQGYIMSSFGVGELGLHLCYETPWTIAVRRALFRDPAFAQTVLGLQQDETALPMIFAFNPERTFIEVVDPDAAGYGQMIISLLDPELPMPLLRYQTGDIARMLDPGSVAEAARRHEVPLSPHPPTTLLALKGRASETLPNGSHVGPYKDALYANHVVARQITGAFRLIFAGAECAMHVQLDRSATPNAALEHDILQAMPTTALRPQTLVLWPYDRFPFGMTLDYERKFSYYVPGEPGPQRG